MSVWAVILTGMDDPPKAPTGLRAPGKRLWVAVAQRYVLTPAEVSVLVEVCRTSDELDRLERAVRILPELTTIGSMGQIRPYPLLEEVRRHQQEIDPTLLSFFLRINRYEPREASPFPTPQRKREGRYLGKGLECLERAWTGIAS